MSAVVSAYFSLRNGHWKRLTLVSTKPGEADAPPAVELAALATDAPDNDMAAPVRSEAFRNSRRSSEFMGRNIGLLFGGRAADRGNPSGFFAACVPRSDRLGNGFM